MNGDYKELVEYLDGKFTKIDERFVKIDERFVKIDERFVKIDERFVKIDERFTKIDEQFVKIDERFDALLDVFVTKDEFKAAIEVLSTKEDFNNLMNAVDAYAAKADKYFQEFLMLAQKVDRHERWLLQIAEKLGLKLEY